MPIPTTSKWPKPRSEDEFEDLSVDFLRIRWKDPHATRNGRRGQRQSGVDIIGHPPWLNGKTAGTQCKNMNSITLETVIAEVKEAKKFRGGLHEFLIVTSADRDARLQDEVREHFRAFPAPFKVEVVFWDDIVADLATDECIVAKHWRGFLSSSALDGKQRLPNPQWIDREGASGTETTEFHSEITLYVPERDIGLDASEFAMCLSDISRRGSGGSLFAYLTHQSPIAGSNGLKWSYSHREYANVLRKWEIEVSNGGVFSVRLVAFSNHTIVFFDTYDFMVGVVAPMMLYHLALDTAKGRFGSPRPESIAARFTAHGSDDMLLKDSINILAPQLMLSAPKSPTDWVVDLNSEWDDRVIPLAGRLINRALSKFTFPSGSTYLPRVNEQRLLDIAKIQFAPQM